MCQDCGCSQVDAVAIDGEMSEPDHAHESHGLSSLDAVEHSETPSSILHPHTLSVHASLLSKNDRLAEHNRASFREKRLCVLNVLSSPGSGKTAFIERMIRDSMTRDRKMGLTGLHSIGVIVGDLETDNDAQRLRQAGAPAIQITTGHACHLEADMIARAIARLDLDALDLLVIENVGNLVCPAAYDLGETLRVVLLSVTEGEDKPLKYPTMFKSADVVILNKMDIADAVGFNRDVAIATLQHVAPQAARFEVSARTGHGMDDWYAYLQRYYSAPASLSS
ncbi:MAG: hydrogenase nickel incorporation protein HypB [Elainellaceae cyanobacterium]